MLKNPDPYLPKTVEIIERKQESPTIFTLKVRMIDPNEQKQFLFSPGQFNMLYLFGVGEIAISISSDPEEREAISHTIRAVGRVTNAMVKLQKGDQLGLRGPYGCGWPCEKTKKKDLVLITGGLGCAPTISLINYVLKRRSDYGNIKILQGVKHSDDLIFKELYEQWLQAPNTEIHFAADQTRSGWPWYTGRVTDLLQRIELKGENTAAFLCGPEMMMQTAAQLLVQKDVDENSIYLSMERNMECAVGHCGHCQYGGLFVCKNGPVFAYSEIQSLLSVPGF